MLRYLLLRTVLLSAFINALFNGVAGWVMFGGRASVPVAGGQGILTDSMIGLSLISALTVLIVTPSVRRDARAGKIPGLAASPLGVVARALPQRQGVRALLAAIVTAVAVAVVLDLGLASAGIDAMPGDGYTWFKAWLSGGFAAVVTPLIALVAAGAEVDARTHPHWIREPISAKDGFAFDYLDKGSLAAASAEHGCSNTPTWQLVVRGELDPGDVRVALEDLVRRYPYCKNKARSLDATPGYAKSFAYVYDPDFALDDMFEVLDVRGEGPDALDAVIREVHDHALDLFEQFPLRVTLVHCAADEHRLLFEQQHALADGRAFIGLLEDFGRFLGHAQASTRPDDDALVPVPRRPELEALGLAPGERLRRGLRGGWWSAGIIARALLRPTKPHPQNLSNDYTGSNGTVHVVYSAAAKERWRPAHKDAGVSLNTLLTAALFITSGRFAAARGGKPGMTNATLIAETRPRDGSFVSFANHLTSFYAAADLSGEPDPAEVMRQLHEGVGGQAEAGSHIDKLVVEHYLAQFMPVDAMRKIVMESKRAPFNLNFSNLIPLKFDAMHMPRCSVERMLVSTPATPRCGIVLTVVRYGDEITFNFNYKASVVGRRDVEEFAATFEQVLEELTGSREETETVTSADQTSLAGDSPPQRPERSVLGWLRPKLENPGAWKWIMALSAVLMMACLNVGFVADDHMHRVSMVEGAGLPGFDRGPLDLFTFSTGDAEELDVLRSSGTFSWWVAADLKLNFWRPLSSAVSALDYRLWPNAAWLMYLHSIAWFSGLLLVLRLLYRRFHPGWVGALALLMYAVDDAHGPLVGWISNRNSIVMTTCAAAALLFHDIGVRDQKGWGKALGPVLFAAALLSAEGAVATLGYLAAHAAFIDRRRIGRRLRSLAPYAMVFVAWMLAYRAMGRGTSASGVYLDPSAEPLSFLQHAAHRIPVLLLSAYGAPWSGFWPAYPPAVAGVVLVGAFVALGLLARLSWPLLRRDAVARFWLAGSLAASVPIAGTFPADRLLVFVGVGAFGLLALLLRSYAAREAPFDRSWPRAVAKLLILIHIVLAPLLLPIRMRSMEGVGRTLALFDRAVPRDASIAEETVVVVNAPNDGLVNYLPFVRASRGEPYPARLRLLSTSFEETSVRRVDEQTLEIRPQGGFLATMAERMLRGIERPFERGTVVSLPDASVTVTEVLADGRPAAVEVRFTDSLHSPTRRWVCWRDGGFVPFELPAVGHSVMLPAVERAALLRVMLGETEP